MPSPSQNQLWSPGCGIRFSPRPKAQPLYPSLDVARFIHTPKPDANDTSLFIDHDMEYLSDDEQFERDLAEWLDQNESLLAPPSPPVGDSPKPQTKTARVSGVVPVVKKEEIKEVAKVILPPVTSLDYTISNELFQAALKCKPESAGSYWSYTMYRRTQEDGPPQKVEVHYCKSKEQMETICEKHFLNEEVIGFDLEWMIAPIKKSARECVSLIQIASPGHIGLFHVAVFPTDDFVGPAFRQIMESNAIAKAGVNIKGDCTRLRNHLNVNAEGVFELSHLYKLVKYSKTGEVHLINKYVVAMADQVREVLRLPMYKGNSVRTSNWMLPLSASQIKYSASDAYAGLQLYYALEHEREQLDPCPPRPEFAEKNARIKVALVKKVDTDAEVDLSENASEDITESDAWATEDETTPEPPKPRDEPKGPDPRIADANLKLDQYRLKKGQLTAGSNTMRIYFLWHDNADLSPESITKIVPLKTNTVVSYIIEAISSEDLPFPKQRVRDDILSFLAPGRVLSHKGLMDEFKEMQNSIGAKV